MTVRKQLRESKNFDIFSDATTDNDEFADTIENKAKMYFKQFNDTLNRVLNRNMYNYQQRGFEFGALLLLEIFMHEFKEQFEIEDMGIILTDEHLNNAFTK